MIFDRVLATIQRHGMLDSGDSTLVAVSGGPDSVALLHILIELGTALPLTLTVAHLDHGLRGDASDADRSFVEEMARALGLPCAVHREDVAALAHREKRSLEDAGRATRRRFLRGEAARIGARRIALGHQRDDQAETVLLRLIEGTGRSGLSGIPPVSDGLFVHPLLDCSRAELLAFLEERGIPFRIDASNLDRRFLRSRIRHMVLPVLEAEINPQAAQAIARTAQTLRAEDAYLETLAERAFAEVRVPSETSSAESVSPGASPPEASPLEVRRDDSAHEGPAASASPHRAAPSVTLLARALARLEVPIARRVVRIALRRAGLPAPRRGLAKDRIDEIVSLAHRAGPSEISLEGGLCARLEQGRLSFVATSGGGTEGPDSPGAPAHTPPVDPTRLPVPGRAVLPGSDNAICATLEHPAALARRALKASSARIAHLDADRLTTHLTLRPPVPGDRYTPVGAPGSRKLSDLWTDAKLSRTARRELVVVESAGEIVWVPGFRPAHPFRVTDTTVRVARLEIDRLPGQQGPRFSQSTEPASAPASAWDPQGSGAQPDCMSRRVLYSAQEIEAAVDRLAQEVSGWAAGRPILAVSVLQGAFVFAADLVRRLPGPVRLGFVDREGVPVSRTCDLAGDDPILLVEDILDTGESLARVAQRCREWDAGRTGALRELRICVMFDKQVPRTVPIDADFTGLPVPDLWVVGYGLDHDGLYRNLPYLTYVEP